LKNTVERPKGVIMRVGFVSTRLSEARDVAALH